MQVRDLYFHCDAQLDQNISTTSTGFIGEESISFPNILKVKACINELETEILLDYGEPHKTRIDDKTEFSSKSR